MPSREEIAGPEGRPESGTISGWPAILAQSEEEHARAALKEAG